MTSDAGIPARVREDQHVDAGELGAVPQLLGREVGVRDAQAVEDVADPPFVLRVDPGVDQADARRVQLVARDARHLADGDGREAERVERAGDEPLGVAAGSGERHDDRARRERPSPDREGVFGGVHPERCRSR